MRSMPSRTSKFFDSGRGRVPNNPVIQAIRFLTKTAVAYSCTPSPIAFKSIVVGLIVEYKLVASKTSVIDETYLGRAPGISPTSGAPC
jgi:hypothetical protein